MMLGSHPSTVYLGETRRLRKGVEKACYICRDKPHCDLFGDIGADRLESLYEHVYEQLAAGKLALVDNSKKIAWAGQYLHKADRFDLRFVHLLRDPRALVRRWLFESLSLSGRFRQRSKLTLTYPHRTWTAMSSPLWMVHAYRWLRQNEEITRFLGDNNLNHRVVTYRDLALHPQEQLGDLMSWLEMEFSPAQLEYWKIDHHGTQKPDYVQSIGGGYFDLRWQSDLDAQVQTGIMQIPEIKRYLTELELGVESDGLCATGSIASWPTLSVAGAGAD